MTSTALQRLAQLGGTSLGNKEGLSRRSTLNVPPSLRPLYEVKNGFLAFGSALHVLPLGDQERPLTVGYWNGAAWRQDYPLDLRGHCFFAQDAFGNQFSVFEDDSLFFLDVESGESEQVAATVDDWAKQLSADPSELTGSSLCDSWQVANGPLPAEMRLVPRIPVILGGSFELHNLSAVDSLEAIRFRAELFRQIKSIPDGTAIAIRVSDGD